MYFEVIENEMSNAVSNNKHGGIVKRERIKKRVIPFLALLFVIAVTITLFYFYRHYSDRIEALKAYGYLGAFIISIIFNATVLLPGVALPILSGLGIVFYPVTGLFGPIVVGLAGGAGAAIGEIVGYVAGYSGRGIVENKKLYKRLVDWLRKWGAVAVFVFSLVPLFFDLVGLAAGVLRFPLWKFVLICWLGRTLLYVVFVTLAALGWEVVLPYFG